MLKKKQQQWDQGSAFSHWRLTLGLALLVLMGCAPQERPVTGLRIVSTAPHLTEALFAIGAGDLLVGRTEVCDDPPEALKQVPIVGGFGTPWLESLLAVQPTHVVETILANPGITNTLKGLAISVVHVPVFKLREIPESLLQLGALTGHPTEAAQVAEAIRKGLCEAREGSPALTNAPRVLLLLTADTPMTAGRSAFVSELLELAGGINVGSAREVDYYQISVEWLLAQNPEMIICLFETYRQDPCRLLEQQIGWKALAAVRQHRVYAVPKLNTVCRPGPRVLEGLAQFKEILAQDARQREQSSAPPIKGEEK